MNREITLEKLHQRVPLIAPSMLKCDFGNLHREVELLESAGAEILHWDVMDGHFVPNLSYGAMVIRSLRDRTNSVFDAHLMISDPEKYVDEYLAAGCDCITFHIEAVSNPVPLLKKIREAEAVVGLAINPGTPISAVEQYIPEADMLLVMSVEPGFGGQSFIEYSVEKIQQLRNQIPENMLISVDGGIGLQTIQKTSIAGADIFVAGSSVFDTSDYRAALDQLMEQASRKSTI